MKIQEKIKQQISSAPVVLYMKGTPDFPQCGFSGKVVHILRRNDIDFVSHNVLEDAELRQGIKDFSQWPTIPQLYVKGRFVGGCDILTELYEKGELQDLMNKE